MIKLKNIYNIIIKETYNLINRGIFIIDNKGKINTGLKYHGEIVFRYNWLNDAANNLFNNSKISIKKAAELQNNKLINLILQSGFILGGVWSSSKRQLYITWYKPTEKAKIGLIKKISSYNPTAIYVKDINRNKYTMYDIDTFIETYL